MSDTVVISCPGCGKQFRGPAKLVGRQVKCPSCHTAFQVPGGAATAAPAAPAPARRPAHAAAPVAAPAAASPWDPPAAIDPFANPYPADPQGGDPFATGPAAAGYDVPPMAPPGYPPAYAPAAAPPQYAPVPSGAPGTVFNPAAVPVPRRSGGGIPPIAKYGIIGGVALVVLVGILLVVTSDRAKLGGTWKLKSFGGRAAPANVKVTMEFARFSNKVTMTTPGLFDQSKIHMLTGEYEISGGKLYVKNTKGDDDDAPSVTGEKDGAEISELTWSTLKLKVGRGAKDEIVWEKE